jgi:sugar phosphate isomerase/epimerase
VLGTSPERRQTLPQDFLATCWTTAGDVHPKAANKRSPFTLIDRIEAASRAGFTGMDFVVDDLHEVETTIGWSGFRTALHSNGIARVQIETASDWFTSGERRSAFDQAFALTLRAADELGVWQIKTLADTSDNSMPPGEMMSAWVDLADRCAAAGAQLAVEPVPWSNLSTVEAGARFVQAAGHSNGGLVVDIWHVIRGGSTLAGIEAAINPRHLFCVELTDGAGPVPAGTSQEDDADDNRLLPGRGEWDIAGFIGSMRRLGYNGPWGIEISSDAFRRLPLNEAVASAAESMRTFIH